VHRVKKAYRSTVVRIAVLSMAILFTVVFTALQLQKNDLDSQVELLESKISAMNEVIYSLEADIARPFDEEYIAEIAHEQLGLCYPQEIIFVSGDGN